MSVAETADFQSAPRASDRTPPQDVAAEQSVLGAMLMSKDAIADVVEVLKSHDFYRPAHEFIFDAVLDLYSRGEPADAITVAEELVKRGEITRVGGHPYLHDLLASVSVAANAGYYATIVKDKAILRRLVEASVRIAQMGYASEGNASELVDRAQAEMYAVTEGKTSEDYQPLSVLMEPALDEIEAIHSRGGEMSGVPTGFIELDDLTNGLHSGQMIILAARPAVGKSTLGLDFARAASIKHGLCSAIFSLEMSKSEIVMRLLSAEAQIPLNHIRKGEMTEEDWARMAKKMGEVSEAPLFIDDSPNLTMMEIRAKARRLKQRHDLKLIIIDYLQLMSSGKKVESRQLEVSEFSRQIKLLAKEIEVPIIAISQLNRGPEQRTDKKPMLSDLRESGCLTADTRILRADTGVEVALGELFSTGETDIPVWSLDGQHKLTPQTMTHVFPSGHREVFQLRLASGRLIKATANHPFLTLDGWKPLEQLAAGSRLATPRSTPEPLRALPMEEARLILLAHMIGDGSMVRKQPIRYASVDEDNLRVMEEAAMVGFGITGVRDDYPAARVTTLRLPAPDRLGRGRRNPIVSWLDELGLFGLHGHEKYIPSAVFAAPNRQVRMFIRHLWATDGSVRWDSTAGQGRIYYASTSRRLADDLCRLLLRCDIVARVKTARKPTYRECYHVVIDGAEQQLNFCESIGVHGARGARAREVASRVRDIHPNTNLDTIPQEVWSAVRVALAEQGMTHRQFSTAMETSFCGSTLGRHSPNRERPGRVASVVNNEVLASVAASDIYWDRVIDITSIGERDVFDATVLETHNFIADGIAVHNSLEQDADMVILLHRDDMYDKESPRLGEADFIVAKHRNGQTRTVTTAFQGHYSRFVDMQH